MNQPGQQSYEFGRFRLDTAECLLFRDGKPLPLTPKAFETLVMLVERSGRLVEKEELIRGLWPDSFVEEANLTNNIWALRKALADGENGERFIETVPKRGYRFIASVKEVQQPGSELIVEKHTFQRIVTEAEEETNQTERQGDPETWRKAKDSPDASAFSHRRVSTTLKILIVCLLLSGAFALVYRQWISKGTRRTESGLAASQPLRSIAVLPFKTIGAVGDEEYLGLGLTDALITKLGNEQQLVVRPTSAVRRYTDANQDPMAAGRQQQVDAVLDGSVQQMGGRLRLTVQLIRVADGVTLWSGRFDERFTDIFAVQDSISDRVACDLVTRICGVQENKQDKINVTAHLAYLKGRYFWNKRSREGLEKAVESFNQAIVADPSYAQAYAGLADSYLLLGAYLPQKEVIAKARAAAQRAIELDDTLAEPHTSLGLIAMNYDWDWTASERDFKRAIELNPNYPTAHHWYAEYLAAVGRSDESLAQIERARELDPLSLIINTDKGKMLFFARRYVEAIDQLKRTLDVEPEYVPALGYLAQACLTTGSPDAANHYAEEIRSIDPVVGSRMLACLHANRGSRDEALRLIDQLERGAQGSYVEPSQVVGLYLALGDKDKAFAWLEKEYDARSTGLTSLKVNPSYDTLRSDPRFAVLMRRVGLVQ